MDISAYLKDLENEDKAIVESFVNTKACNLEANPNSMNKRIDTRRPRFGARIGERLLSDDATKELLQIFEKMNKDIPNLSNSQVIEKLPLPGLLKTQPSSTKTAAVIKPKIFDQQKNNSVNPIRGTKILYGVRKNELDAAFEKVMKRKPPAESMQKIPKKAKNKLQKSQASTQTPKAVVNSYKSVGKRSKPELIKPNQSNLIIKKSNVSFDHKNRVGSDTKPRNIKSLRRRAKAVVEPQQQKSQKCCIEKDMNTVIDDCKNLRKNIQVSETQPISITDLKNSRDSTISNDDSSIQENNLEELNSRKNQRENVGTELVNSELKEIPKSVSELREKYEKMIQDNSIEANHKKSSNCSNVEISPQKIHQAAIKNPIARNEIIESPQEILKSNDSGPNESSHADPETVVVESSWLPTNYQELFNCCSCRRS